MMNKDALCEKIRSVFPDIGVCGIDLQVDFDEGNHAYVLDLKHGNRHLKTFMEVGDADACLAGRQCVSLGLQIAQLRENLKKLTQ